MDRLSEIRARCEAFEDSNDSYKGVRPQYILPVLADDGYSRNWAEIAAHSHEDIPYLLARLEKAEGKTAGRSLSMERLTTYRKDGRAAIANKDEASPLEQTMKIPAVIDRLAAYEDTGLKPEEIKDFMSRWKDAVELAGLCKEAGSDHLCELAEAALKAGEPQ